MEITTRTHLTIAKNLNFHLQFPNPKKQLLDKRALMISYW